MRSIWFWGMAGLVAVIVLWPRAPLPPDAPEPSAAPAARGEAEAPPPGALAARAPAAPVPTPRVRPLHIDLAKPKDVAAAPDPRKPPRILPALEERLHMELSEEQVKKLEAALPELQRQAYTTARDDGWELHLLREDSLFSGLGFRDGDLITYRSLDGNPAVHDLAGRIVTLLEAIEK